MSASTILTRLKEAGVQIAVSDGQLKLKGPKSALNEDVLSELRAIKAELIKLLSATEPASASQAEDVIAGWRNAIRAVHSDKPDVMKLKAASIRFLDGPDAITSVDNGWDALSLFGMHEGACPRERVDCWGIVLFIAWGVHGCTVETIDQKVCALRTRSGAVQSKPRLQGNFHEALPWWEHPGIVTAGNGDDDADCA